MGGEGVALVAIAMGLSESKIRQIVDDVIEPADVKVQLVEMAEEFGCEAQAEHRFVACGIPGKSYTPDCVWWDSPRMAGRVRAIFEIDKDVSPKHYAGGVALANMVALMTGSPIDFF